MSNLSNYDPAWGKEVKKALIDKDINITTLAKKIGYSRGNVSGVINGRVACPVVFDKINKYLFMNESAN